MSVRLLNLGRGTAKGLASLPKLSIKYCRSRADLSIVKHSGMKMIRSSTILGIWLVMAGAGVAGYAQTPPPDQVPPQTQPATPPAAPPATSPAIIALPPQGVVKAEDKEKTPETPPAAQDAPNEAKPAAGKGGKNRLDPSKVPGKDATAVGPAYVIGAEDVLFVRVWESPEFTGQVAVGPDGMISLQLIDEVKASGLTAHQLEEVLAKKLKAYLVTPEVNVQVLAARSRRYIILGDGVVRPGIYPITREMTVMEALIAGGGFSPFAKKNKIYIMRGKDRFPFNWNEVSKGKKMEQDIQIQNGDKIYVP